MRILVTLVSLVLLAGCMGSDEKTDPTPTPTPATPTPTPTPASPTPTTPAPTEPTPASPTPATPTPTPASPTPATPTPTPTPTTPTPPPAPVAISIVNIAQGFDPETITIPVGTNVTWTNNDPVLPHTATDDNATFDSGNIAAGGTYSYVFTTAGTYAYHCKLHSTMTAVITVQ